MVQELAANWGAYAAEDHGRLIAFFAQFLPRAAPDAQAQVPLDVLNLLFEPPDHALAVIEGLDPVPDPFRPATLDRLIAHASDPSHWQAALPILTKVAGEEAAERIAAVFGQLIAAGHLEPAAQLFEANEAYLRPQLSALAENAAPHLIERINSGEALPVELFETLAAAMEGPALDSIAEALAARLRDGAPKRRSSWLRHSVSGPRASCEHPSPPRPSIFSTASRPTALSWVCCWARSAPTSPCSTPIASAASPPSSTVGCAPTQASSLTSLSE